MGEPSVLQMNEDEYLAWEGSNDVRHEFVGGVVYAMSGGSIAHSEMILEFAFALRSAVRTKGCWMVADSVKFRIDQSTYYYPDLMVTCEPSNDTHIAQAPCLVVEVVSPSTELIDRREKLAAYLKVASVSTYVIVDPMQPKVTVHQRVGIRWTAAEFGRGDTFELPCPGVTVPVDDLYPRLSPN